MRQGVLGVKCLAAAPFTHSFIIVTHQLVSKIRKLKVSGLQVGCGGSRFQV